MYFKISRTSLYGDDKPPCEEAFKMDYFRTDIRTTDDPMKKPHIGKSWYETGENHRVINGQIARDFKDNGYFVKVESLEGLVCLRKKYGDLILSEHGYAHDKYGNELPSIEIYDDYRE